MTLEGFVQDRLDSLLRVRWERTSWQQQCVTEAKTFMIIPKQKDGDQSSRMGERFLPQKPCPQGTNSLTQVSLTGTAVKASD